MKLEEVLPAMRSGKKIRRKSWERYWRWLAGGHFEASSRCFYIDDSALTSSHYFNVEDALAQDWEIIE